MRVQKFDAFSSVLGIAEENIIALGKTHIRFALSLKRCWYHKQKDMKTEIQIRVARMCLLVS